MGRRTIQILLTTALMLGAASFPATANASEISDVGLDKTLDVVAECEDLCPTPSSVIEEECIVGSECTVTDEAVSGDGTESGTPNLSNETESPDNDWASQAVDVETQGADENTGAGIVQSLESSDDNALEVDSGQLDSSYQLSELKPSSGQQEDLDAFAASHAGDIENGLYEIRSGLGNDLVMDVDHGSTLDGANIIVWSSHNAANQRWRIQSAGGGYFSISSVATGKYLDITGEDNSASYGTCVVQWSERHEGARGQKWIVSRESDGYKLTSALLTAEGKRLVLDVEGGNAILGSKLILWDDKSSFAANQRWSFFVSEGVLDSYADQYKAAVKDGYYLISSSLGSSLVLDVAWGSKESGTEVDIYPKHMGTNQIWHITHDATGYLTVTSVNSNKVLDVCGGFASPGSQIIQWSKNASNSRNQKWIAMPSAGGTFKMVAALASEKQLVLDVFDCSTSAGTKTILWPDKGGNPANQRWGLEVVGDEVVYAGALADGVITIRTALNTSKLLDVAQGSMNPNAPVVLWFANGGDNQVWNVTHDAKKYVHFSNKNSGKELGFTEQGIAAQVSGTFAWIAEPLSDGTFRLRAVTGDHSGKYLDVDHARTDDGTTVLAWDGNGGKNQTWVIGAAGSRIIALDPGHGGGDSGATANGLRECDLTWSITQSCAEQLRAYGYTVYITVGENEFKNGSTVSISNRVQRAYDHGAEAIFSMHINAGGGHGAVTLVPNNSSYHHEVYEQGQRFANLLLPKINSLGIGTWSDGSWERDYSLADGAESNAHYPGGGYQDYYGIVRYARLKGMLGVIIEHGFIDSSDANLLRQSSVQRKLGQMDAEAIRELYV